MDESASDCDVSMSPGQILERLQLLRQIQILQKDKLTKQRLEFQNLSKEGDNFQALINQLTTNTSYNTFHKLLQNSIVSENDTSKCNSNDSTRHNSLNLSQKIKSEDLVDGVQVLNLSQESVYMVTSEGSSYPNTSRSLHSQHSSKNIHDLSPQILICTSPSQSQIDKSTKISKKQIELDEMPILSPRRDFETLLMEKLNTQDEIQEISDIVEKPKKPFLRRGVGLARFGVSKDDLVIQDVNELPWKKKNLSRNKKSKSSLNKDKSSNSLKTFNKKRQSLPSAPRAKTVRSLTQPKKIDEVEMQKSAVTKSNNIINTNTNERKQQLAKKFIEPEIPILKLPKSPPHNQKTTPNSPVNKSLRTWGSILTADQENFLKNFKHSDVHKNIVSPAKSLVSDFSFDDALVQLRREREIAEQNMFELIENKVTRENFNIHESFFQKFLNKEAIHDSRNDTPIVMQQCLQKNPLLMKLFPAPKNNNTGFQNSELSSQCCCNTNCDHETCSTLSTCSTCKTVDSPMHSSTPQSKNEPAIEIKISEKDSTKEPAEMADKIIEKENLDKNKLAEMNAELISTSKQLKERLNELEDEIEAFKKENSNLNKIREDLDSERQKFYEEKASFEQKFSEEKVLAEYYLAEEKEKIARQKQLYDRQIRELRGRLNKKDKDEVQNLKKEIECLREEIRIKDAKSTTMIAKLRNQVKTLEKEKKDLHEECEKLKVQNKRIQQTNSTTRRLSNLKYLQEINKKLSFLGEAKVIKSDVYSDRNAMYISGEIEERKNHKAKKTAFQNKPLTRAKSAPNLNVTSRYAKYFSQKDAQYQKEQNDIFFPMNDDIDAFDFDVDKDLDDIVNSFTTPNNVQVDNEIEQIYYDTFRSSQNPRSRSKNANEMNVNNMIRKSANNGTPHSYLNPVSKKNNSRSSSTDNDDSEPNSEDDSDLKFSRPNSRYSNDNTARSVLSSRQDEFQSKHSSYEDTEQSDFNVHKKRMSNDSNNKKQRPSSPRPQTTTRSKQRPSTGSSDERHKIFLDKSPNESFRPNSRHSYDSVTSKSNQRYSNDAPSRKSLEFSDNSRYSSDNSRSAAHTYNKCDSSNQLDKLYTSNMNGTVSDMIPTEFIRPDGSKELRFPNGNIKYLSPDGNYSKFVYYNGDVKETFYNEGRIKYFYAATKTCHTTHADGHEVLEFPDGQVEKKYKDGSTEVRLPNGNIRYTDPKNPHVNEEWRFPDGTVLTVSKDQGQVVRFPNGQVEVHTKDHKRREYPDGTVRIVYNDGTIETRYKSGRVRIKDSSGALVMDTAAR